MGFEQDSFEYDIFLGGPPDRRSPIPYRTQIKAAYPQLRIYDWEDYKGEDYQAHNDEIITKSLMMVTLVPDFPMPGIGPEIGYFCCSHQELITLDKPGLPIGYEPDAKAVPNNVVVPHHRIRRTPPINRVIIIWPDEVKPDFTKKTIGHYGLIVSTMGEAIKAISQNWLAIKQYDDYCAEQNRQITSIGLQCQLRQGGGLRFRNNKGFNRG